MTIGLLGGSFDPAHGGHVHITRAALRSVGVDRVWWLVSPGNPLKPDPPAPLADRLARGRAVMRHPRVVVTGIEAQLGTRMTADTIDALRRLYPGVRFVWLMGADNLAQFHRWGRWHDIVRAVPIGIFARPGWGIRARRSVAAQVYGQARAGRAERIADRKAPAWVFVNLPMDDSSSSAIRAAGEWLRRPAGAREGA
jgi:nicotinate-nucleotide adenylyltransferase